MKKLLLLFTLPLVFITTLSAQITQTQADEIIQERMNGETKPFTVYALEEVQTEGFTAITSTGEALELEYSCWVYYVNYAERINHKYLIVKESNGNLLEINTRNDEGPEDLDIWRLVANGPEYPIEIPFDEYFFYSDNGQESPCWVTIEYPEQSGSLIHINSNEELEQYFVCINDYPEIDFSTHTLLVASGFSWVYVDNIVHELIQKSKDEYFFNITVYETYYQAFTWWIISIIVPKIPNTATVTLDVIYTF